MVSLTYASFRRLQLQHLLAIGATLMAPMLWAQTQTPLLQPHTIHDTNIKTAQIAYLNNGRWAAILGNGHSSYNQRPALLIQYLDGDLALLRIVATSQHHSHSTTDTAGNGLSTPRLVDINRDGRSDVAYAGDIQGNLWKFDLTHPDSSRWVVAFDGHPLFTALGRTNSSSDSTLAPRQPITTAPIVRLIRRYSASSNDLGSASIQGLMVAFGTGLNNHIVGNKGHSDVHSLYGVLDHTHYSTVIAVTGHHPDETSTTYLQIHPGRTCPLKPATPCTSIPAPRPLGTGHRTAQLVPQQIGTPYLGTGTNSDRIFWRIDSARATHHPHLNASTYNGWYLDLPPTGEHLHHAPHFYDGSDLLVIYTQILARTYRESPRYFLTLLNIMDGSSPRTQILDMNGDGIYESTTDQKVSRVTLYQDGMLSMKSAQVNNTQIQLEPTLHLARPTETALRPSWRQFK